MRSEPRPRSIAYWLRWLASSSFILTFGFLLVVYLASLLAQVQLESAVDSQPDSVRKMQMALTLYARTMLVKGLLPQLLLALMLWPVLDRVFSFDGRGRLRQIAGIAACAILASAVVIPALLMVELPSLPAVRFRSVTNLIVSALQMSGAVGAAMLVPRRFLR